MTKKEAIEVVKKNYPHIGFSGSEFECALRELIPELAESEDEKISKEIVEFLKLIDNGTVKVHVWTNIKKWILWLEKQKEKLNYLSVNRVEVHPDGETERHTIGYLEKQKEQEPLPPTSSGARYYFDEWIKQQPTLKYWNAFLAGIDFNKKEQKRLDIHSAGSGAMGITHPLFKLDVKSSGWSEEDKYILNNIYDFIKENTINPNRVNCAEECLNWLKLLPERFNPRSKQEWSEEQVQKFNRIIMILYEAGTTQCWYEKKRICEREEADSLCDFLKSFRPQLHWKPSGEQMRALWAVEDRMRAKKAFTLSNRLASLYNDLKKLL